MKEREAAKSEAEQARHELRRRIENERDNFRNLFRQTPEMVCILRGPEHVFEFVNEAHIRALGFDATGKAVREAQPESVEVHGILDDVYRTGKTAHLNEIPVTLTDRVRYFNLTYAARRDDEGRIDGIMILGVEVTEQVLARRALADAKREAERAQRLTEVERRKLEALFMYAPAVINVYRGPEHVYELCNLVSREMVGGRDLTGLSVRQAVPEVEVQGYLAIMDSVYKTGEPFVARAVRNVLTQPDGSSRVRYFDVSFHPWYDMDGKIAGLLNLGIDMTDSVLGRRMLEGSAEELERKVSERTRELGESRSFLDSVIENIPNMVFVKDARDLRFVRFNRAGEDLLGISRSELIGKSDYDFFPKEQADHFTAKDREVLSGRAVLDIPEEPILAKGGERRFLHTRKIPVLGDDGKPEYLLGISEDITEFKLAEAERTRIIREQAAVEERKSENERASFLAEASTILASSLDYHRTLQKLGRVFVPALADWCTVTIVREDRTKDRVAAIHRDPAKAALIEELAGFYPANIDSPGGLGDVIKTGQPAFAPRVADEQLVAAAQNNRHLQILQELGCRSSIVVPIISRRRALGAIALVSGSRIYNESDLAMAIELGRRAGIAMDNAFLFEAAQKAVRARDEFMSIASHELRTPLTSLKLHFQLRSRDLRSGDLRRFSPERLPQLVSEDEKQVNRLIRLVEDMLDVSRIQTGNLSLQREKFDLSELVRETLGRFAAQIEARGARVTLEAQEAVTGEWDRFRLEQVFTNLLTNALKYGAGKPVRVRVSSDAERARIEVADQGMGIAGKDLGRIFERFERAVSASSVSGLGLGLFISKNIVESHGGSIRVTSEPGKGSTFTVEVPRAAQPGLSLTG